MNPIIIIAIIVSIVVGIVFAVFLIPSMQENSEIIIEEQTDEAAWQLYQKTYLEQECRELYIGQTKELEECYDRIDEEQRLNPPTSTDTDDNEQSDMNNESMISEKCTGIERCISGKITDIIDGDTIRVDGETIRFSLSSAPELDEPRGMEARKFIGASCLPGSDVIVDQDDLQPQDKYGRILGVVYCNEMNLNERLLESGWGYLSSEFCSTSEFENDSWAQKYGCKTSLISMPELNDITLEGKTDVIESQNNCDSSYPDFCIPSSPPDLNCGDIAQKKFTVLQPDPHRFDGDKDGIGCES